MHRTKNDWYAEIAEAQRTAEILFGGGASANPFSRRSLLLSSLRSMGFAKWRIKVENAGTPRFAEPRLRRGQAASSGSSIVFGFVSRIGSPLPPQRFSPCPFP